MRILIFASCLSIALVACSRQPDTMPPAATESARQEAAPQPSATVKAVTDEEMKAQLKTSEERSPLAKMTPAERQRFEQSMLEQAAKFAAKGPPGSAQSGKSQGTPR